MATYAGKPTCTCGAAWLPVFVEYLDSEYGIKVQFVQLIGSAAASAGTHGGGLCFDLVVTNPGNRSRAAAYDLVVKVARDMGADATWHRPYNWDGRKGMEHVHGLGNGCPHLKAAAKNQQTAVRANRNGLANNGKDTGPRPISGRTYKQGIEWAEDHMAISDNDINRIKNAILHADEVKVQEPTRTAEQLKKDDTAQLTSVLTRIMTDTSKILQRLDKLEAGESGKA